MWAIMPSSPVTNDRPMQRPLLYLSLAAVLFAVVATGCGQGAPGAGNAAGQAAATCLADDAASADRLAACTQVIDSGGGNVGMASALIRRGDALYELGRFDDAAADFAGAIALEPDHPGHYMQHADALMKRVPADAAGARADLLKAVALAPDNPMVRGMYGSFLSDVGESQQALVELDRAIALAGSDTAARAKVLSARCWGRAIANVDLEGALADCDAALDRSPDDANVLNSRGFVRFRLGRFEDALADYDRALALDADVASSHYMRGLTRRRLGQEPDAATDIAAGVAREPGIVARYAKYGVGPDQ
jgi:tetratricopeptide (TPR) repeat protein